jgi:hypothetical protein
MTGLVLGDPLHRQSERPCPCSFGLHEGKGGTVRLVHAALDGVLDCDGFEISKTYRLHTR